MEATIEGSVDGRTLVKVRFQRESPEGTEPEIEAVFTVFWPTDFMLDNPAAVLHLRSTTRVDTREPVELLEREMSDIYNAVAKAADEYDQRLLGQFT
jgi:hypothetical protein